MLKLNLQWENQFLLNYDNIMAEKTKTKVPAAKIKAVKELSDKIKNSKTLIVASIKGVPSKQFQAIKKSIRDDAYVKVAKKNIMIRAIKDINKNNILELEKYINENSAFVISNIEGFELAAILNDKKTPVVAKAGQIAEDDIEVKEGPTDLVPGPAISELGALGLKVAVEAGKLSIKGNKIVVTKGNVINSGVASVLQKLHMQPFSVGLKPVSIYDIEKEKIYTEINVDPDSYGKEIRESALKALGFAKNIIYYCKETVGYFLAKANMNAEHLNKLNKAEEK